VDSPALVVRERPAERSPISEVDETGSGWPLHPMGAGSRASAQRRWRRRQPDGHKPGAPGAIAWSTVLAVTAAACGAPAATPKQAAQTTGSDQPVPTVVNPWQPYETTVHPNTAIDFATATTGWRIGGQSPSPHIDRGLSAPGINLTWPGTSVLATTDGGAHWVQQYSDPTGVWGLDFIDSSSGWAVGVKRLEHTADGGQTWTTIGEPSGHTLVAVDFASRDIGYGLTTIGMVVRTTDAGKSWSGLPAQPTSRPAMSLCHVSSGALVVGDNLGAVSRSSNQGATWATVYSAPPEGGPVTWDSLSCSEGSVLDYVTDLPGRRGDSYLVASSGDGGASWSTEAASDPSGNLGGLAAVAPPAPIPSIADAVLVAPGTLSLIGYPLRGSSLVAVTKGRAGGSFRGRVIQGVVNNTTLPAQQLSSIHGTSFSDANNGWVLVDVVPNPDGGAAYYTVVEHTSDGGATWSPVYQGALTPQSAAG
jgi:hypothetical protein